MEYLQVFFMIFRDLQNIVKDLSVLKENLAKVKMGHALFPMISSENNEKHIAFLLDRQRDIKASKEGTNSTKS